MNQVGSYKLKGKWHNSPNGKYGFAEKNGKEFFIKQFLKPVYPMEGTCSPKVLERRKIICKEFEEHQNKLLKELKNLAGTGGNLVVAVEFFRFEERYYKVSKKVVAKSLTTNDISRLTFEKQLHLMKTISQSIRTLHRAGIVHGDLKPENILISKSDTENLITKIIDFDDSYFESKPPASEDTIGTVNYYSPELAKHVIFEDEDELAKEVTCKSDVFALGIIFHEYITGSVPKFPRECEYRYVYEGVLDGKKPIIDKYLDEDLKTLIESMLLLDYKKRPSTTEVFECLKKIVPDKRDIEKLLKESKSIEKTSMRWSEPKAKSGEIGVIKTTFKMKKEEPVVGKIKSTFKPKTKTNTFIEAKDLKAVEVIPQNNNQYKIIFNDGTYRTVPCHYIMARGYDSLIV